jgi:hypothetical protein
MACSISGVSTLASASVQVAPGAIGYGHGRGGGEGLRDRAADARTGAGDECDRFIESKVRWVVQAVSP